VRFRRFNHKHALIRGIAYFGYLNEQTDFYSAKKVLHFAQSKLFYKLVSPIKKTYTTTDLFSP
jgi:hypothetical protein